jgi:hypothetical protein
MKTIFFLIFIFINFSLFAQIQTVNVGTSADDGTGDNLRSAFQKVNNNNTYLDGIKLDSTDVKTKISDSLTVARAQLRSDISDSLENINVDSTWLYGTFTDSAGISRIVNLDSIKDGITGNWYEISDFITSTNLLSDSSLYLEAGDGDYFDVQTGIGGKYFDAFIDDAGFGFDGSGFYFYGDNFNLSPANNNLSSGSGFSGLRRVLSGGPATRKIYLLHEDESGQGVTVSLDTINEGTYILELNGTNYVTSVDDSTYFNHYVNVKDSISTGLVKSDSIYDKQTGNYYLWNDFLGGNEVSSSNAVVLKSFLADSFVTGNQVEEDFYIDTLNENQFTEDGDRIRFTVYFDRGSSEGDSVKFYFADEYISLFHTNPDVPEASKAVFEIVRTSSTTARMFVAVDENVTSTTSDVTLYKSITGVDFASEMELKFAGWSGDASDMTAHYGVVEFISITGASGGSGGGGSSHVFAIALSDSATELTTGNGDSWDAMFDYSIDSVRIGVNLPPTGSNLSVDINKNGTSIFSTEITIDAGDSTSVTATTPYSLSTTTVNYNDRMNAVVNSVGSTFGGAGIKLYIYATKN